MCVDQHMIARAHGMRLRVALELERCRAAQQRDPFGARAVVPEARRARLPHRDDPLDRHAALLDERVDPLVSGRGRRCARGLIEQIAGSECLFHRFLKTCAVRVAHSIGLSPSSKVGTSSLMVGWMCIAYCSVGYDAPAVMMSMNV